MRQTTRLALSGLLLSLLLLAFSPTAPAQATRQQAATKTETPTPQLVDRPVIVAVYSFVKHEKILPGSDFTLKLDLYNQGNRTAYNVTATLQGDKLIPRENGGVQVFNDLAAGTDRTMRQTMYVAPELDGQSTATLNVSVVYTDDVGSSYSTVLVILIDLTKAPPTAAYVSPAATRTPTSSPRSKLLITSYKTDLEKLQSGNMFKLTLDIQNQGNAFARNVTMVLGGATITSDSTPSSGGGGVSGGGADLSKFAPLGSSNLYALGEIVPNTTFTQTIPLVVNVSTDPGAYPLKISFVYEDGSGNLVLDDQVITMLVYGLPQVSVSFYEPVPDLMVGEFRTLPIQITNVGKRASVLGDITISASSGMLNKNTGTIGTIEAGGYFTMDAEYTADTPETVTVTVQIKYTDDFQQPGLIEKTLTLNVIEMPPPAPDGGGEGGLNGGKGEIPVTPIEETLTDKLLKALLGFFGFSGG
jgi:hypothetical protein